MESPDRITIEARFVGTNTAPLKGPQGQVPPTGKTIDLPFVVVLDVEGGKVKRHRGYFDQMSFLGQLGLLPAPA